LNSKKLKCINKKLRKKLEIHRKQKSHKRNA